MPLNISFRQAILGLRLIEWNDLIIRQANITPSNKKDYFVWSLYKNGEFLVKSMYIVTMNSNKIPMGVKASTKDIVILTKNNLAKRKCGETNIVVSVMLKRQFNISSSSVMLLISFGDACLNFQYLPPYNATNIFGYHHVFQLAPLLVYDTTIEGT
uniref:Reverse transcriptase zinc-binding domain-containing protein n=1 Tax=Leersia perrieri TaxID=77586 RepID=A0A0D9V1T4_9ORYZ